MFRATNQPQPFLLSCSPPSKPPATKKSLFPLLAIRCRNPDLREHLPLESKIFVMPSVCLLFFFSVLPPLTFMRLRIFLPPPFLFLLREISSHTYGNMLVGLGKLRLVESVMWRAPRPPSYVCGLLDNRVDGWREGRRSGPWKGGLAD